MARQPLDSLLEEASAGLSQAAARAAPCNTLTWKWDQEKSTSLLLLEVLCRKILPGKFISWESESKQILVKNGQTHWQRWSQLGCDRALTICNCILGCSSCSSPHTLQLTPPLANLSASWFSSRHLSWPGSGKKGKWYHLDLLKKATEQNVTSLLMAQQPSHSCHVSRSCDRAGLVGRTSKFTDKGNTELMISSCQILSVEELWLSDQLHLKLLADEAKLAITFWPNPSLVVRRPDQRAVTPLSP